VLLSGEDRLRECVRRSVYADTDKQVARPATTASVVSCVSVARCRFMPPNRGKERTMVINPMGYGVERDRIRCEGPFELTADEERAPEMAACTRDAEFECDCVTFACAEHKDQFHIGHEPWDDADWTRLTDARRAEILSRQSEG
jgi:hypothetical protein